jgi:hypothetical protein
MRRLFFCFLFAMICFTVSGAGSGNAEFQNQPLQRPQQPLVKPPVQRLDSPGRPCNMTSVNNPAQAPNGEVFINGTGLSEQCIVSFTTPYVTNYRAQKMALMSPTSLKVWVPALSNGGTGTINMKDPQNQYPEIKLPFMIVEGGGPACEIRNVAPQAAAVNGDVVIDGKNLGTLCTISFKDSSGKMLGAPVTYVSPLTMKVKVPTGAAPGSAGIYTNVAGRTGPGFGPWVFNIITGTACQMTSLTPSAAKAGDSITVKGTNFSHTCSLIIDDSTKKRFTLKPPTPVSPATATVKLPTGIASGQAVVSMIDDAAPKSGTSTGPRGFPLQIDPASCELSSVTPNYGAARAFVLLKGNKLDQNCMVFMKSSPNGKAEQAYTTTDKDGFKARVPDELIPGVGTIEARPYGGQKTPGRELPFEVLPTAAVLQSLSPTGAIPGTNRVTVMGTNLNYLASSKAIIELPNGEKFDTPTGNNSATKFDLMVIPDVYKGYSITAKNAEHRQRIQQVKTLYVQKGNVVSNKLGLNIRSPYPILDQINPKVVYPGDTIIVNGGNWDQSQITTYDAIFYLPGTTFQTKIMPSPIPPPLIPVPYFPNITLVGMFSVKVPDVFAGRSQAEQNAINTGTVQMSINGPGTFSSNKLDIQIRKKTTTAPPTTTGSCPGAKYVSGYTYVGQPGCATNDRANHPSAYLSCDATGYYCCESSPGAKTKCGTDRWTFPADCMSYCASAAGNCLIGPMVQDGIFYGCYKQNTK